MAACPVFIGQSVKPVGSTHPGGPGGPEPQALKESTRNDEGRKLTENPFLARIGFTTPETAVSDLQPKKPSCAKKDLSGASVWHSADSFHIRQQWNLFQGKPFGAFNRSPLATAASQIQLHVSTDIPRLKAGATQKQ